MARKQAGPETFTALYDRMFHERRFVSVLLTGHLTIEFLLRKLVVQIDPKWGDLANSLRHEQLVKVSAATGTITEGQRDVLLSINSIRNRVAHQLTYEPTIAEFRTLLLAAQKAFVDFTDGIEQGIGALDEAPGITSLDELEDWPLGELFTQICYDLHHLYIDRGGDVETF